HPPTHASLLLSSPHPHPHLHPFPTRRSSDLFRRNVAGVQREWWNHRFGCRLWFLAERDTRTNEVLRTEVAAPRAEPGRPTVPDRSEEHTSELQSLRHLVCRLLLEKKKHRQQL